MRILILISRKLLLFLRILLLKSGTKILVRIMRMFLHSQELKFLARIFFLTNNLVLEMSISSPISRS
jgi:hypothetical protein